MRSPRLSISCLALAAACWSCGAKDDDNDPKTEAVNTEEPVEEPVADPVDTSITASLTEGSASQVMGLGLSALQSGSLAVSTAGLRLLEGDEGGGGGEASVQSANDPLCSNKAEPWNTTTNQRWESGDGYVERLFYCAINGNTPESADSLIGQLTQQKSIFCSLEAAVGISADKFTEEGNDVAAAAPVTVNLGTDCWPQGAPDGITSIPMSSIILKKMPAASGFQYSIKLVSQEFNLAYETRFFNKDGVFGFSTPGAGTEPGVGERFDVTIDTNKAVILLNVVNDRNKSDDPYLTLVRLRVDGTFDKTTGKFSAIGSAKGIYVISGPGFTATADDNFLYSAYEVSGNSTTGFRYRHFWNQDESGTGPVINTDATECSGGTETCADAVAMGTEAEVHAFAVASSATKTAWSNHIQSGLPLCEAATGAAAITLSAAPASTGAFGVCE